MGHHLATNNLFLMISCCSPKFHDFRTYFISTSDERWQRSVLQIASLHGSMSCKAIYAGINTHYKFLQKKTEYFFAKFKYFLFSKHSIHNTCFTCLHLWLCTPIYNRVPMSVPILLKAHFTNVHNIQTKTHLYIWLFGCCDVTA
jgi:hypothetical protein